MVVVSDKERKEKIESVLREGKIIGEKEVIDRSNLDKVVIAADENPGNRVTFVSALHGAEFSVGTLDGNGRFDGKTEIGIIAFRKFIKTF